MSLGKAQKRIITTATVIFIICLAIVINDELIIRLLQRAPTKDQVGVIDNAVNDTRRRLEGSLVWLEIQDNDAVYDGDSIFSGPNSESTVVLPDDSKVHVRENALMRFVLNRNELFLDLRMGNLELTLPSKGTFLIRTPKAVFRVRSNETSSRVNLSLDENLDVDVKSLDGAVFIEQDGGSVTKIENQETAEIKLKTVEKFSELIDEADAISKEVLTEVSNISDPINLNPASSANGPALLIPLDESIISIMTTNKNKKFDIAFMWEPVEGHAHYEIEFSSDPNFQLDVKKYNSQKNSIIINDLNPGKFYWRVRSVNERGASAWSLVFSFHYPDSDE